MPKTPKAGALLSRYLKDISNELTLDGKTTKAELLARKIWELALGESKPYLSSTGKMILPQPDKLMIAMIFDRLEGKIGSYDENLQRIEDIPDKVSKVAVAHINRMAMKEKVA